MARKTPVIEVTLEPDNVYKVPAKQWNKWSVDAKVHFNNLFGGVAQAKDILIPHGKDISDKAWQVACWNICWLSADGVDGRW